MAWGPDMRFFACVGAPSLALPFKGVKRRACEPLVRAPLNARSRMRSAGLLGEAGMAELGNVGWGWVCPWASLFAFPCSSFRRKPESSSLHCIRFSTRTSASAHLKVSGLLSLAWPRESNQREGHPGGAVFGHPATAPCVALPPASMPSPALQVRERATGFAGCTSVYIRRTAAHRARPPADSSYAPSPRLGGPGWAASCRRSQRQMSPTTVSRQRGARRA